MRYIVLNHDPRECVTRNMQIGNLENTMKTVYFFLSWMLAKQKRSSSALLCFLIDGLAYFDAAFFLSHQVLAFIALFYRFFYATL